MRVMIFAPMVSEGQIGLLQIALWVSRPMFVTTKQQPEGPVTEDPSTKESHYEKWQGSHGWSNHQDQAL